jgi:cysteine desulfurase / selenocysteine lyase
MRSIDLAQVRADTPGTANVIHFNNAGSALMPTPVLDAVVGHLQLEARIGGYEAARACADRVEDCYDSIARLLGCSREEIAVVENARAPGTWRSTR